MRSDGRTTTLADVHVGASAVLVANPTLDARQARRLVELGLRPGATVRVMMRTAGGGRVLGVDNLRIVVDRSTLGAIPVTLHRASAGASSEPSTSTAAGAEPRPRRRPNARRGRATTAAAGRRLRLLGRAPGLTALPVESIGDGAD